MDETDVQDRPPSPNGLAPPPPRKKRRITLDTPAQDAPSPRHSRRVASAAARDSPKEVPPATALLSRKLNGQPPSQNGVAPPIPPVKHPIPRVRLIVRKPPEMLSHPLQKPPPKQFGGSVDALLASFTFRGHFEAGAEEIDADLAKELALWRQVDALRREGRMVERSSYEFRGAPARDAWAEIVREVERAGPKFVDGREMARNVAGKVEKHWQMENKVEEARMKGVARSTLNMVLNQWRKAVYVSATLCGADAHGLTSFFHSTCASKSGWSGRRRSGGGARSI